MSKRIFIALYLVITSTSIHVSAQEAIYKEQESLYKDLFNEISKVKAIDNHAHPLKYVAKGEKPDDEFDALPIDAIPPFPLPVRLSATNPEFIHAWHDLYGYSYHDMSKTHLYELMNTKQRLLNKLGNSFPAWVLDQLNIETMFSNRIAMGPGLIAPRFKWVAFDDALLFPLSNEVAKRSNPDYGGFFPAEERLLKRYLDDLKISALPESLDMYLRNVITPILERQKANGTVAIKFEAAYLRKLDFDDPDDAKAHNTYLHYIRTGEPPAKDYKSLQDFLFYYIAREAGRLGMAVHLHCFSGVGGYFQQSGSNPLLLQPVFNDSSLRKTNFVVIHGGYPFTKEMSSLMSKPNVYADFSLQTLVTYPHELSEILRNWLESYPEKILFGTDAFSFGPEVDWSEVAWLSNNTARKALALALTGMMNDGEIDHSKAMKLAHMVLHDNAHTLYGN
jgi:predicted TIM-barrel fold metal-dependent hydrolase